MRVVSAGEYLKKKSSSHNFDAHPLEKQMKMTDKQPATFGSNSNNTKKSNNDNDKNNGNDNQKTKQQNGI